jgi:hypothetical protein
MSASIFECMNVYNVDCHPKTEVGSKGHYRILACSTNRVTFLSDLFAFQPTTLLFAKVGFVYFTRHEALSKAHFQ